MHVWYIVCSLFGAVLLDWVAGDPPNRFHPTVWMGSFIQRMAPGATWHAAVLADGGAGRPLPLRWDWGAFLWGTAITVSGAAAFALPVWLAQTWLQAHCWPLSLLLGVLGLKAVIAYRGLARAAGQVQASLLDDDLPEARRLLSWHLVSRDTRQLGPSLVAAATIESVAENMTDAVTAPLLYFALGGLPAAWAYRFVNTGDSLLGYRDPVREYLGKFPARLDDLLNWLPARLTGVALVAGAALAGGDARRAARVMMAQHQRTASPNAGWTMSAMAGALGVTLEKVGHYRLEGGAEVPTAVTIGRAVSIARAALLVVVLFLAAIALLPLARAALVR